MAFVCPLPPVFREDSVGRSAAARSASELPSKSCVYSKTVLRRTIQFSQSSSLGKHLSFWGLSNIFKPEQEAKNQQLCPVTCTAASDDDKSYDWLRKREPFVPPFIPPTPSRYAFDPSTKKDVIDVDSKPSAADMEDEEGANGASTIPFYVGYSQKELHALWNLHQDVSPQLAEIQADADADQGTLPASLLDLIKAQIGGQSAPKEPPSRNPYADMFDRTDDDTEEDTGPYFTWADDDSTSDDDASASTATADDTEEDSFGWTG